MPGKRPGQSRSDGLKRNRLDFSDRQRGNSGIGPVRQNAGTMQEIYLDHEGVA